MRAKLAAWIKRREYALYAWSRDRVNARCDTEFLAAIAIGIDPTVIVFRKDGRPVPMPKDQTVPPFA